MTRSLAYTIKDARIKEEPKVELHYSLEGPDEAPVLVLSNSLGTTLSMWDEQASALRDEFRLLRYDHRGHGGSPVPRVRIL